MTVSPPLNPITCLLEGNGSLAGRDRAGAFSAIGSGALRYAAAPGARVNYAPYPLLDTGVVDYLATSTYTDGWREVTTATGDGGILISTVKPYDAATYTIAFDAYGISGVMNNYDLSVAYYNADSSGSSSVQRIGFTVTASVQRFVMTFTATAHSYLRLQFRRKTTGASSVMRLRNLTVEMGSTDGSWFTASLYLNTKTGMLGSAGTSPSVSRAQFWVEEATTNLCFNPSFETNTTGWASVSADITRDTTSAYLGSASMKVTRNNAVTFFNCYHSTATASVSPGDVLTISARLRGAVTLPNFTIDGNWKDASFASVGSALLSSFFTVTAGGWTYITFTTPAAPALTSYVTIGFTQRQSGTIGDAFYLDCVQIEKKAYATSYCLSPDTIVATPSGVARLGDVSVGDSLIGQDRVNSVIAAWPVDTEAYELSLDNGVKIVASAEHRFMVSKCPFDERRGRSGGWRFRELGDLIDGDYVQLSTKVNAIEGADEPDMAYVLGYLLGDGYAKSATKRGQTMVQFSFGLEAAALAERVRDSFVACMPMSVYHGHHPMVYASGPRELLLTSQNRDVYNEFASRGFPVDCGAQDKTLPECVWTYKEGDLLAFLAGLIDSDGTVDKNLNLAICSSSKQLIVDLQRLCAMRLGVHGWIQSEEDVSTGFAEHRNLYRLRFKIADGAALYEMGLPLKHERKAERLRQCVTRDVSGLEYVEGRRRFARIVGIVPVGKRTLIDITLDPDHDFIAEGAVTHNCDGSLGTGYTWAGTAHASASTRATATLNMPSTGRVGGTDGSMVARTLFSGNFNAASQVLLVGVFGQNPGDYLAIQQPSASQMRFSSTSNGSGNDAIPIAGSIAANTWYTHYAAWTATTKAVARDLSGSLDSGSRAFTPNGSFGANPIIVVGGLVSGSQNRNGYVGSIAIYDAPLSTARRTLVNTAIDSNGATDLWTLFEEWEGVLSPLDVNVTSQTVAATAGASAILQPLDVFALGTGSATAGASAIIQPLDIDMSDGSVKGYGARGSRHVIIPSPYKDLTIPNE